MGRIAKYSRRAFLVGSVAVAGGVAFGTYLVKKPVANPLADDLGADEASFNPWVRIGPDRITLITPHVDLGQGAVSMQAALIAEEMDLDLGQFDTDFGRPAPAYYNTAMGTEAAPFRSNDDSFTAEMVRGAMGAVFKVMGMQGTGGSSSVPDSFTKLRVAGAVARETLKQAAAMRAGIGREAVKTESGAVLMPDGSRIPYTDLAADAAKIAPVDDVTLRDPSQWRLLGKPMQRTDIVAKSTGAQTYGIDQRIEGMVHATVRLSPRRSGLNGYDAGGVEGMPGVMKVLPVTDGVAVVATNTWYAIQAAQAIDCDWADATYPAEQDAHWQAVAASFTEDRLDKEWRNDGDVAAALAGDGVIEAEYRAPYVAHQPLEPLNAIARVTDDGIEIWTGHQMPRFVQQIAADVTGHDPDQVTFRNQWSGGSFGHRLEYENIRYAVEIASQMRGTPVKLTFPREEDFAQDYPRQIGMARNKGAVRDGRIVAADFHVATVSSSRSQLGRIGMAMPGADSQIAAGLWNTAYAVPNLRVRAYAVPGLAPTSSWRSVGASTAGFFNEAFMDELIVAAGLDPMQARIDLCTIDHHRRTLEAVAEMCGWSGPLGNGRGRGVAMVESFGVPCAEVVEVSATARGIRIDKVWVAADVGRVIDPATFENQVQGGVVWGLGHAMNCEITYSGGMAEQTNFDSHEAMRIHQCPEIFVRGLENGPKVRGVGEPPVPPAAPALANAIFAATGQRLREMPFNKFVDFV